MATPASLADTLARPRGSLDLLVEPTPLICVALSLADSSHLATASLFVLSVNLAFGVLFILADELDSCRRHNLGLLRCSAAKSRSRIEKLGIKSKEVDRFLNTLWFDHELELRFKRTRVRSVELLVLALDLLSRLASCYGRSGRRVFEANQTPIVNALHLFECLPVAETEKALVDHGHPILTALEDTEALAMDSAVM